LRQAQLRLPGLKVLYDAFLEAAAELLECRSAWEAERWLVGAWASVLAGAPAGSDTDLAAADLVDEAGRCGTPGAAVLSRVLAVVGPQPVAAPAPGAAGSAAGPGVEGPGWLPQVGAVTLRDCRFVSDVFREQVYLIFRFSYAGGEQHAMAVRVDVAFGGLVTDIDVGAGRRGELLLTGRVARACGGRRAVTVDLPAGQALDLLVPALAVTLHREVLELPALPSVELLDAAGWAWLPVLRQRLGAVAAAAGTKVPVLTEDVARRVWAAAAAGWPRERRAQLVAEFLRDREGELGHCPSTAMVAARMADASIDVLRWPPDRIGPLSAVRLLTEVVPGSLVAPEEVLRDLEVVAPEWFLWVLGRAGLPGRDRARAETIIHQAGRVMARLCRDPQLRPEYPYVADLPRALAGGEEMFAVLERRMFAVPLPGRRGDGLVELPVAANGLRAGSTHVDDLMAARAEHRSLITAIEQSRYGVSATAFPSLVGVVNQLWDDDPPQVWAAAQRLTRSGLPRRRVIEQLGRVWARQGPGDHRELEAGRPDDGSASERYLSALARLGR
jgi:hypothetical protein